MRHRYSLLVLMQNEFAGEQFVCVDKSCSGQIITGDAVCTLPSAAIPQSMQVLELYNMNFVTIPQACGILLAMSAIYRGASMWILSRRIRALQA